jgi:galactokinase
VLTAKAFDKIYELDLTTRRIMELAYLGETASPSRCGKMDQACAYDKPVIMTFDGDKIKVEELVIPKEINLLIIDLRKGKDTKKILTDLNRGFPWPNSLMEKNKHMHLGSINKVIVNNVKKTLEEGDAAKLGILMNLSQGFFDDNLMPACPEELEAPVLHFVLSMGEIKQFIFGGKGVGSGGDGTAQLVCKSREDREKAKKILIDKGFGCFELDLKPEESLIKFK